MIWDPSIWYTRNDLAIYGGSIWRALVNNKAVIPEAGNANWELAVGGSSGGGAISGTIASGQVAVGSGTNAISGSSGLTASSGVLTAAGLRLPLTFSDPGNFVTIQDNATINGIFVSGIAVWNFENTLYIVEDDTGAVYSAWSYEGLLTWNTDAIIGRHGGSTVTFSATNTILNTGAVIANGTALKTDTTTAHTALLQAYDVDGTAYKTFGTLTNGNTPDFTISPPAGTTVVLQATTYKSSDGSSGVTAGPFTTITAITVKNGLVTALTGS